MLNKIYDCFYNGHSVHGCDAPSYYRLGLAHHFSREYMHSTKLIFKCPILFAYFMLCMLRHCHGGVLHSGCGARKNGISVTRAVC